MAEMTEQSPAKVTVDVCENKCLVDYIVNEQLANKAKKVEIEISDGNQEKVIFEVKDGEKLLAKNESKPFPKGKITVISVTYKGSHTEVIFKCKKGKLGIYFNV